MSERFEMLSENHPLRALFRAALDKAFVEQGQLFSPGVAAHLADDVLCDFVHVDRIFRLKNAEGRRLEDLPKMLEVSLGDKEGPERRLEVDGYIGDFTLFMGGFFPASLGRARWFTPSPMVSKVRGVFVKFERPLDYYMAEGRNAYERAAETARLFAPDARETYSLLGRHYESYLGLLGRVKTLIADDPELRKVESILD
ncbi:MAG: hypothetical protein HY721_28070 [Planctomycetes bacterium]|nr:hypothetical protein [Planctomycetota bacterium]